MPHCGLSTAIPFAAMMGKNHALFAIKDKVAKKRNSAG
jgi:hypothetical protein